MSAVGAALNPKLEAKLLNWLDHDPDRFERYLAAHPEVTDRVDELTLVSSFGETFRSALGLAIEVPLDLAQRMATKLSAKNSGTDAMSVLLDLMGVGSATLQVFLDPD